MINSELHARFCANIKSRRNALELTQVELAKRLNVSQPTVAQMESGSWVPTLDTVEAVAKALELPDAESLLHENESIRTRT